MLDAWMWAREKRDKDGVRPGLTESRRWVEGYKRIAEQAAELPETRLVYVAEREADMVEMMRVPLTKIKDKKREVRSGTHGSDRCHRCGRRDTDTRTAHGNEVAAMGDAQMADCGHLIA